MKNKIMQELEKMFEDADFGKLLEIRFKAGIFVGRISINGKNYIVKYFENANDAVEIEYYSLLKNLNVQTPEIIQSTKNLMVMEDIDENPNYHLATAEDLKNERTMRSLARWYKNLHENGKNIDVKGFYSELDYINKKDLEALKPILPECENLEMLIENIDKINDKINSLNLTLTYNDFAEENMIAGNDFAMMFDFNKMGRGLAYFDIQNVCFMLDENIKAAFVEEYGLIPEEEKTAYDLLVPFITLVMASKMPNFPNWAVPYKTKAYETSVKENILRFLA